MLAKASTNLVLGLTALFMAQTAQGQSTVADGHLVQIGAGGLLAYLIIKLVLDYLRNRDNTAVKDRRVEDSPNGAIALSRELVAVLADIKVSLNESRNLFSEQHERQTRLLTEIATMLRMSNKDMD